MNCLKDIKLSRIELAYFHAVLVMDPPKFLSIFAIKLCQGDLSGLREFEKTLVTLFNPLVGTKGIRL